LIPRALRLFPQGVAFELCSGAGIFSKAWRRHPRTRHIPIFEVDIRHGPDHDLALKSVQQLLRGFLRAGLLRAFWVGLPSDTFLAGRRDGDFRSPERLWGVADLSPSSCLRVLQESALALFAVSLLHLCRTLHVPAVVENPSRSMLWMLPQYLAFQQLSSVRVNQCDDCMFGSDWRVRRQFVSVHVNVDSSVRDCSGRHRHSRFLNSGSARAAGQYPFGLCTQLCGDFGTSFVKMTASKVARFFTPGS
jgi:hypothetical protein